MRNKILKVFSALPLFISFVVFCETGQLSSISSNGSYIFGYTIMNEDPVRPAMPTNSARYRLDVPQGTFKFPMGSLGLCPLAKKRAVYPPIPDNAYALEFIHPTQPDIPYCVIYVFTSSLAVRFRANLFYWVAANNRGTTHSRNAELGISTVQYSGGYTPVLDNTNALVVNCVSYCSNQTFTVPRQSVGESNIIGISLNFLSEGKILLVGPRGITPSGSVAAQGIPVISDGGSRIVHFENLDARYPNKVISSEPLPFKIYANVPSVQASSVPEQVMKTCSVSADSAKSEASTSRFNPAKYIDFPVVSLIMDCSHTNVSANSTDKHTIKLTKTVTNLKNKKGVEIPFVPRRYYTPSARGKDSCKGKNYNIEAWLNTPDNTECNLEITSSTGTLTGFGKTPANKYKISLGADWSSLTAVPESGDYSATYILTVEYD